MTDDYKNQIIEFYKKQIAEGRSDYYACCIVADAFEVSRCDVLNATRGVNLHQVII